MNILFICNQNQNRSITAQKLIPNSRSAGLYNENPVKESQIEWADMIITMEDSQRTELAKRFPKSFLKKRILTLGIHDIYKANQPELISVLKEKLSIYSSQLLN